jgi:hypothetical protein
MKTFIVAALLISCIVAAAYAEEQKEQSLPIPVEADAPQKLAQAQFEQLNSESDGGAGMF